MLPFSQRPRAVVWGYNMGVQCYCQCWDSIKHPWTGCCNLLSSQQVKDGILVLAQSEALPAHQCLREVSTELETFLSS